MFNHWEGIALHILKKNALLLLVQWVSAMPKKRFKPWVKGPHFLGGSWPMGAVILQKRMDPDFQSHHETPPPLATIILMWVKPCHKPSPSHHMFISATNHSQSWVVYDIVLPTLPTLGWNNPPCRDTCLAHRLHSLGNPSHDHPPPKNIRPWILYPPVISHVTILGRYLKIIYT